MKAFWVILASATCFGCTCNVSEQQKESAKLETDVKTPEEEKRPPLSPAQQQDLAAVVEGNNQFAFDLYRQLSEKPGNKFFSPYSISTALGMTYVGARGNTAKEMARTLHFSLDNERLHPAFGALIRKIRGEKERNYELAVANSLWGDKTGFSVDPGFLRITQTDYQADYRLDDFIKDAEGVRRRINGWVEDRTNKKIENLLPMGFVDRGTRLILVNAIYFRADWSMPFPKDATKPDDFTIPGTPTFKVPMMNRFLVANYVENKEYQLVQLMYKDNEVSIIVILPKKKDGLSEVEKKLSAKALTQALALARSELVRVALPKFKMTEAFRLERELESLGMKDAFLSGIADFTGMETNAGSQKSLFISAVVHKAFVEVDEKGTEAAGTSPPLRQQLLPRARAVLPLPPAVSRTWRVAETESGLPLSRCGS